MATNTPWGPSQDKTVVARGCTFHSTASHGGFLIGKKFAAEELSTAAQKRGVPFGNYLAYEEDCLATIILLEIPDARKGFLNDVSVERLIESISFWNGDYLIERGIEPNAAAFARFLEMKQEQKRRAEKCPDLIISAMSLKGTDVVKVYTANGSHHFVTKDSYKNSRPNNLSNCVKVEGFQQTTDLHY